MLVLGLLLPILLGLTICQAIIPHSMTIPTRLALAYSLGFGFLTLAMFFLNVIGLKFSLLNTTILVSAIIGILLVFRGKRNWLEFHSTLKVNPLVRIKQSLISLSAFEKVLVGLLVFFLFSHLVITVYWPVVRSDSLTLYDLRAKLLFTEQSFPEAAARFDNQLVNMDWTGAVFSHAPMTSLVHTWLYLCGWASPKIFYPLLFISMAILFYHFLRIHVPRYHALLFTLVLVTIPFSYVYATISYPHFVFTFYFSVGTFLLYRWIRLQKTGPLLLAGIFLGLSAWVRQVTGIFFIGYLVIVLYFGFSRRRFFAPFLFAACYFAIASLWNIYSKNVLHFTGGIVPPISEGFSYLLTIRRFLLIWKWKNVLDWLWNVALVGFQVVHYLLLLTIILYINRVWKHRFLFLIILSNLLFFLIGVYIASLGREEWSHGSSVQRLYIMFLPIIWYFIALITAEPRLLNSDSSSSQNK
ncbi:hypothetical protein KAT51_07580 [bacterium]|nr:hypothetical protein [bacterium]